MIEFCPLPPSSRGPGRSPFKAKTGVRISVGAHEKNQLFSWFFVLRARLAYFLTIPSAAWKNAFVNTTACGVCQHGHNPLSRFVFWITIYSATTSRPALLVGQADLWQPAGKGERGLDGGGG